WNLFESRDIDMTVTDETAAVYTEFEKDELVVDAYETGDQRGWSRLYDAMHNVGLLPGQDFVQMHIDNMTSGYVEQYTGGGTPPWQESMRKSGSTSGTTTTFGF